MLAPAIRCYNTPTLAQPPDRSLPAPTLPMDISRIPTKRLTAAIDQLPDADMRRLVTLRYVRGLAVKEIVKTLNISRPSYYRRLQKARKALTHVLSHSKQDEQKPLISQFHHVDDNNLVGVQNLVDDLTGTITADSAPWLIAVDGIGGIGKTTLATKVVTSDEVWLRFERVLWVSAKQEYWNGSKIVKKQVALSEKDLAGQLLNQLGLEIPDSQNELFLTLTNTLKSAAYLVVIDNLETVRDYETLLPLARNIANPSKVLITSRHSLRGHSDIRSLTVGELSFDDAVMLVKQDAVRRGMPEFEQASNTEFEAIYEAVGGNPLALKLIVGQLSVLPLSLVIENLKQAQGQDVDALYNFIYWQAWELLDAASQKVFLVMPIMYNNTADEFTETLREIEPAQIQAALQLLVRLSLIQVSGDLDDRRYNIHRLTETFLMNEAIRWQSNEDRYGHIAIDD